MTPCRLLLAAAALALAFHGASAEPSAQRTAPHKVTTPAQRCLALEKQFDEAPKNGADSRSLTAARKLRAEGGHLCDGGRHAAGALRISRALAVLGLEPKAP